MTIESSPPPAAPKSGSTADSRNSKTAGRDPRGEGAGGFMAALAAAEDPQPAGSIQVNEELEPNRLLTPVDAVELATNLVAIGQPVTSAVSGGDTLAAPQDAAPRDADAKGLTGAKVAVPTGVSVAARQAGAVTVDAEALSGDGKVLVGLKASKTAKNAPDANAQTAANPTGAAPAREQDTRFLAALEAMKAVQFGREPALAAVASAQVLAAVDRAGEDRSLTKFGPAGANPAPQAGPEATFLLDAGIASAAGEPAVAPEIHVVQQVSYWISQEVQNAEMKLDGLGKEAVEVSIRMHGNEAHVAFRTDELDTRGVLEGAAAQLKDMLQREGLVLSGVSVGSSGAGNSGADERRQQRSAARQAQVLPAAVAAAEGRRAVVGQSGRTLDLFV